MADSFLGNTFCITDGMAVFSAIENAGDSFNKGDSTSTSVAFDDTAAFYSLDEHASSGN